MPARASSIQRTRRQRVGRPLPPRPDTEPDIDSYFDPFDRLVDELVDRARPPFGEAVERALAGRYELFPAELNAEGGRLCGELAAADAAIVACCKQYCATWPDQFGRLTSPALRRMVAAATVQIEALIPDLVSYTARLNAFLDSAPLLN